MFGKLNLLKVVTKHLETFKKYNGNFPRTDVAGIAVFFGLPLPIAAGLVWIAGVDISDNAAGLVIAALSIFTGLLFGLPIALINLKLSSPRLHKKFQEERSQKEVFRQLIDETFHNIMYCILISITAIILTVWTALLPSCSVTTFICFTIYCNVILTIFMIIKRVHLLFSFLLQQS